MKNELEENENKSNNTSNTSSPLRVIDIFFWSLAIILWLGGASGLKEGKDILFALLTIVLGVFACPRSREYLKKFDFFSKYKTWIIIGTVIIWFISPTESSNIQKNVNEINTEKNISNNSTSIVETITENPTITDEKEIVDTTNKITLADIPEFSDKPYVEINGNIPFFDDSELITTSFEKYSELDNLGRVGIATACIEKGMDDKPRSDISNITPTAWKTTKYDGIDGSNLYNRCHLIALQLTGENDNEKNLMTGTRYMNTQGMERFENQVSEYINNTEKHVLYRVTPMFENDDLLAKGVLMEAKSVEDNGKSIQYNVFCYNVQPGIEIDYKTGESKKQVEEKKENGSLSATSIVAPAIIESAVSNNESSQNNNLNSASPPATAPVTKELDTQPVTTNTETYVLNKNTKKFHHSWCSSVNQMKEKNKEYSNSSRDEIINRGYVPCQRCSP